mmetsp:Transcript_10762/g.24570  ORF Transcript_10762/g.24570 Transcript_10762/m.24570 type:complete len:465 (-) Transcript_10762:163-1557(-)|eukprot:CAMPEP_0178390554 /NCGR_PEP_ID=MMETSP0689_2-20121128/10707_1 /TAXON_ID=160604 /ORGANISM="Amphidinium massartii, Strain CS-259" /LENGTH=464 /DNA_ID=CAMNT_0020011069 /DNA_START=84 /DNA_END=1478 /DNA_ORIENTATION=-
MGCSESSLDDEWNQLPPAEADGSAFYLNILVTKQSTEFLETGTVNAERRGPDLGFASLQGMSCLGMHRAIQGDPQTEMACQKICKKLNQHFEETLGVNTDVHRIVHRGGLAVLRVHVLYCDGEKLLKEARGESCTENYDFGHHYWQARWCTGKGQHATGMVSERAPSRLHKLASEVVDSYLQVEIKARKEQDEPEFMRGLSQVLYDEMRLQQEYPASLPPQPQPWFGCLHSSEDPETLPPPEADGSAFYLNLLVTHRYISDMERRPVSEQLVGPVLGFQSLQGLSRQAMADVLRGDGETSGACDRVVEDLDVKLQDLGLQSSTRQIMHIGAIAVCRVHIEYLDAEKLLRSTGSWDLGQGRWSSGRGPHATNKAMSLLPEKIASLSGQPPVSLDERLLLEVTALNEEDEPEFVRGLGQCLQESHHHWPVKMPHFGVSKHLRHLQTPHLHSLRSSMEETSQARHAY